MREMKDSGIPWIGEIPVEWQVYPARYAFSEIRTKNTDGSVTNALKFYNGTIVPKTNFDADSDEYVADTITNYTVVNPDTIMINGLNLNYDLKSLRVGLVKETGVITSAYLALWPNSSRILPQYATYLFKGYETKMAFHNMGAGIRKTLGFKEFKRQPVLIPAIDEQQRIVTFLDTECARIDAVMEQTRASIEEYKKLKQSIITEAVTKGIRPNRPMKDSGIDWIGQIPADWEVYRIANLYDERNENGQEDLPILSVSINTGISDHEVADEEQTRVFVRSEDKTKYKRVYPGDLAYNMMRAWQGAFGAVRVDGMVSPAYVVAKPKQGIKLDSRFMEALLRTPAAIEEMHRYSRGITDFRLRLYWPEFKNIRVCIPSETEQNEIADFIDEKSIEFDALIAKKEHFLSEMESYKKSLIFEYVTGKKEVL